MKKVFVKITAYHRNTGIDHVFTTEIKKENIQEYTYVATDVWVE